MDQGTMIRVIAGVLCIILIAIIIARRKRMAAVKRNKPR